MNKCAEWIKDQWARLTWALASEKRRAERERQANELLDKALELLLLDPATQDAKSQRILSELLKMSRARKPKEVQGG